MAQYINKADVVAEIERRINENKKDIQRAIHKHLEEYFEGYEDALVLFKEKFLDTLEVKEVDLENYVHGTVDYPIIGSDFPNIYPNYKELKDYCDKNRIMDNDKVKLIIVKEDMP